MSIACPVCKKEVQINKWGKIVAHKRGNVQCAGAGKRISSENKEKNK